MKKFHPSPALVISLIALFVALGGTSYAAITTLPRNSVGTPQLKNGAVTGAKLNSSALSHYLKYGGTLPSGMTESGDWGFGTDSAGGIGAASEMWQTTSFPIPLASALDSNHTIYVTGASATHCSGAGHADAGYLCVYQNSTEGANTPNNSSIFNPENSGYGGTGSTALVSAWPPRPREATSSTARGLSRRPSDGKSTTTDPFTTFTGRSGRARWPGANAACPSRVVHRRGRLRHSITPRYAMEAGSGS
jgi:hypothetical protein